MALIDTSSLTGQTPDSPLAGLSGVPAPPVTSTPLPVSPGAIALANTPQAMPAKPGLSDEDSSAISTNAPQRFGHFASALGKALDNPELQQNLNKPGGWAKSLVAGAQNVLSGLGNASTEKVNPGGGWLEGVTRTLANVDQANRQKQLDAQNKKLQDDKNARENDENIRQNKAASIANENAMMVHDQVVNSHLEEGRQNSIKTGSMSLKPLTDANAPIIKQGVDSSEINNLIRQNHLNPTQIHAFATGEAPMGEPDKNGVQQYRTTYTLVGDVPQVTIDEKKNPGMAAYLSKWTSQPVQDGQVFDGVHYGSLVQQANTAETVSHAQDQIREQADLDEATKEQRERMQQNSVPVSTALSKAGLDPVKALGQFTPEDLKNNPKIVSDTIAGWWGSKEDPSGMKGYETAREKQAEDAQKKAEQDKKDSDKKLENMNFGDATLLDDPKAYRESMDPAAASLVDSIGTGHTTLPNLAYVIGRKPELAAAVTALYPDFDSAKAQAYPKLYTDFTSGADSKTLKAGSTALNHMMRLYNNTDTAESRNPLSEEYKRRQADYNQLSLEVAKFSNGGTAPTKEEIADAKASMGGDNWYSLNRKAGIEETARLIGDGMNDLVNKWNDGAPSKYYQAPVPVPSKTAMDAAEYIKNGGKFLVTDPNGGVHTFPDQAHADGFKKLIGAPLPRQPGATNTPKPGESENPQ